MSVSSNTVIKVAVIAASGIAINKLSDLFDSTAPIVIFGSLLALLAVLLYESHSERAGRAAESTAIAKQTVDLVKFCLASLLLGAVVGGVSMLPLLRDRMLDLPNALVALGSAAAFHLFELGSVACITALGIWAVLRRNPPLQVFAFLASAVAGMTLAIAMRPAKDTHYVFNFTLTFVGWLAVTLAMTFLVYIVPDIVRLYSGFWFKSSERVDSDVFDKPGHSLSKAREEAGAHPGKTT